MQLEAVSLAERQHGEQSIPNRHGTLLAESNPC
jgi:hypothetical protein